MENADVANVLAQMASMTEVLGGNSFKVRAFRQAAQVVDGLPGQVSELRRAGELESLPGIGPRIASKIGEILDTGTCEEHTELASRVPIGLIELLRIEGLGPKTAQELWHRLGVTDVESLREAIDSGRIRELPRMGPVRLRGLVSALGRYQVRGDRMPLYRAVLYADGILERLRAVPGVLRAEVAGSVRRRKETVGDVDLLVASRKPTAVMDAFTSLPDVAKVIARGETKSSVRLESGLQVDLRVLAPDCFGAALHYFTGSKSHNIALRTRAVRMGIKLSEYGVFDREGKRLAGEHEDDVFAAVGLPWIPPELREGAGEIEAAEGGELPRLVEDGDLQGDLHLHSKRSSDGRSSLEDIWAVGRRLGRKYLAITDHTRSRPLGLGPEEMLAHAEAIRALSRRLRGGPKLLAGAEVDILLDGDLDLPDEVLARLDWVVASIHSRFHETPATMTRRIVRAIESGVVDAIGHPSGRKIGKRDPYEFDFAAVLRAARAHGVALELNSAPDRLDLDDRSCRLAKEAGVQVVIDSDAHVAHLLDMTRYGVWVARRGWLEKGDVRNAGPVSRLRARRRKAALPAEEEARP